MSAPTVRSRPEHLRRWCLLGAAATLILFGTAAALLRQGAGHDTFGIGDQIAVAVLGVIIAVGIMVPARSQLRADADGIWLRNALSTHTVPWELVAGLRFDGKTPWAFLEFPDGDLLALMALRAADGDHAVEVARGLRRLLEEHTERGLAAEKHR
ncbi:MAG TPA: PH domain-containing protein [Mycobacteriales bacterium]|nr:PH domain-containing protein [Mycobacteriales bacterium]